MRKILTGVTLFLVGGFLTVGSFLPGSAKAEEFIIGFAGAQTGGLAPFDAPFLEGAELAVHQINEAGGVAGKMKIKMLI